MFKSTEYTPFLGEKDTMHTRFHRTLLIFSFIFILALTASCQSQKTASTSDPESLAVEPTTPTEEPTPNADQARAAIISALLAVNSQSNRMEVSTVLGNGATSVNVIEFVPPDRKRIISSDYDMEYIVIGEQVYAKTSGNWAETEIPAATFMGEEVITEMTIAAMVSDAQFVRVDTLDGKPVVVYSYLSTTMSGDIELNSQVELWVGADDGLPYQMINTGDILSAATDPASGESTLQAVQAQTTTTFEFDPSISIEPPLP